MMKITNEMMIPMMVPSTQTIERIKRRNVPLPVIKQAVMAYYNVTEEEMENRSRKTRIIHRRQVMQFLMEKFSKKSLSFIGMYTGGYDHATIIHSRGVILDKLETNYKDTRKEVEDIQNSIYKSMLRVVDTHRAIIKMPIKDIEVDKRIGGKEE